MVPDPPPSGQRSWSTDICTVGVIRTAARQVTLTRHIQRRGRCLTAPSDVGFTQSPVACRPSWTQGAAAPSGPELVTMDEKQRWPTQQQKHWLSLNLPPCSRRFLSAVKKAPRRRNFRSSPSVRRLRGQLPDVLLLLMGGGDGGGGRLLLSLRLYDTSRQRRHRDRIDFPARWTLCL